MLKNYLKIAFRNLIKRRVTTLINLLGLCIGISLTVLLILYARYELDYDRFHPKAEMTYRLLRSEALGNNEQVLAKTSPQLTLGLAEDFPEVAHTTLLFKYPNEPLLSLIGSRSWSRICFDERKTSSVMSMPPCDWSFSS